MSTTGTTTRNRWRRTTLTAVALILTAALVFGVRSLGDDAPPSPGDSLWQVTLIATINTGRPDTVLRIAPPFDNAHAQLVSQSMALHGVRLRRSPVSVADRNLALIADEAGRHRVRIVFEIRQRALPRRPVNDVVRSLQPQLRERYLRPEVGIQSDADSVQQLAAQLDETHTAGAPLPEHIITHVSGRIALARGGRPADDALSALRDARASTLGRARAAVALLRAARIPARLVSGVVLDESRRRQPHLWLEVFHEGRWQAHDPEYGYLGELPPSYVAMNRGGEHIAWTESGAEVQALLAVERQVIALQRTPQGSAEWLDVLDFTQLPQSARATIGLLLLLPLGALVTAFARLVLGVKTYGIFSPALLALAAQFVDFATAAVIVTAVALIGFLGLAALPRALSRTPRLAVVFTLVTLSMAVGVAALLYLGRSAESVVVLLPVVVLTALVDSFYAVSEKSGLRTALTRLGWTALAAVVCWFIFAREDIGQWLLEHPEAHLATMGAMVGMGAFRSKRLASRKRRAPEATDTPTA